MIGMVTGGQFAFWILAPVMVPGRARRCVLVRKAVHSALLLAIVMICLAVLYAAQDAPFLFAVQIIVYTGAILMLFLFVLMLVGVDASDSLVETIRGQRLLAVGGVPRLRDPAGRRRRQRDLGAPARPGRRAAGGERPGPRAAAVRQVRVRLRGHLGAADHRGDGRDGAGPPRAARPRSRPSATTPRSGSASTPTRASTRVRCRLPAYSPGTTPSTRRRCCRTGRSHRPRSRACCRHVAPCSPKPRSGPTSSEVRQLDSGDDYDDSDEGAKA